MNVPIVRRWLRVQSIGTVRRPGAAEAAPGAWYEPWAETVLEIDARWAAGLAGVEEFSHLVVLFHLDRARRRRSAGELRRPEGRADLPPVGFFATRTPNRPNPIGIACPRLLRREGANLIVSGIDAWDGTPILDVKGYYLRDELRPDATAPPWLLALWQGHDERSGSGGAEEPSDEPDGNDPARARPARESV